MIINKKNWFISLGFLASVAVFSSCNEFLERSPLSSLSPDDYFTTEEQLAAYTIGRYSFSGPGTATWTQGPGVTSDNSSDKVCNTTASTGTWQPYQSSVPNTDATYSFTTARACNFFLEYVQERIDEGRLEYSDNVAHYFGEIYFIRAQFYYGKLVTYGDYPIVDYLIEDDEEILIEASKRLPRNEVARFILEDLDKAIDMMYDEFGNKNRISRKAALLLKSRVALFEASWLTYHKGTARVPGTSTWPGGQMDYNADFSIDIDSEIDFFLTECMSAAKELADGITLTSNSGVINPAQDQYTGWNDYFEMFACDDPSVYDEVILWKDYDEPLGIYSTIQGYFYSGSSYGVTRSAIKTYLMANGLPTYAAGSGYSNDDTTLDSEFAGRDPRLNLFVFSNSTLLVTEEIDGEIETFDHPEFFSTAGTAYQETTGYRNRKYFTYDPEHRGAGYSTSISSNFCDTGWVIYRGVEALLNYMEASCMANGGTSIDATAASYWVKIRERAGVSTDYAATIAATDLDQEEDWGAYSAGQHVPAMLFNIRRERAVELACEAYRWSDLKRWSALDQITESNPYIVEGCNFWAGLNDNEAYDGLIKSEYGSTTNNISPIEQGTYVRPYQKVLGADCFDGYIYSHQLYLSALPSEEIAMTCSKNDDGSIDYSTLVLYQNPYWSVYSGSYYTDDPLEGFNF